MSKEFDNLITELTNVQIDKEKELRAFLAAYRELCLKFRIKISGCGCCDSPFIFMYEDLGEIAGEIDEHINHLLKGEGYEANF